MRYIMEIWYKKWSILTGAVQMLVFAIMLVCVGFAIYIPVTEVMDMKGDIHPVQRWGHLEEQIDKVLRNPNAEKGSIIWIGSSVTEKEAIKAGVKRLKLFNTKVEIENADYDAGILANVNPMFEKKRKMFYVVDDDVTKGLLIVLEDTDVNLAGVRHKIVW